MILRLVFCLIALISSTAALAGQPGTWSCEKPGAIFDDGEQVEMRYKTDAQSVSWTVIDYWKREVESGTAPVAVEGLAVIKPRLKAAGYYLLKAVPVKGGQPQPDSYGSFAIIRPHQVKGTVESPFGAMTHFAQGMNTDVLPLLKKIGISSIRDEHYWADVERQKGVYEFSEKSTAYMAACQANGIDPLVEMTFGNKFYDSPEGPSTPTGYAGYANYGEAILKQFGPQVKWLEVWNEYNGTWCPKEAHQDRSKFYAEMLKAAYTKIKATRPDVQVLGGAAVLIPLPYLEGIFKHDGLKYMDGVVVHPYRGTPEGVDTEVAELQEMIRKYNNGQDKPVWVTETGRHSKDEYEWERGRQMYEKGREESARYLARQYTLLLKQKVAKIYWYLASDHAEFVSMGLLRHHKDEGSGMVRLSATPAYVSYANLIHQLEGAEFVRREAERPYSRAHVYLFRQGAEEVRVCWTTQPSRLRVTARAPLTMTNLMGTEAGLPLRGSTAEFEIGENVIYLRGKVDTITEIQTGPRVLASSHEDYTKTQGGNGWSYGFYNAEGQFTELAQVETMWGYKWGGNGFLSISQDGMHPEHFGGKEVPAVKRWKSPLAGKVLIKAMWTSKASQGDGITGSIRVDGRVISKETVGGTGKEDVAVIIPAEVRAGSLVDFVCSPNASTAFDATEGDFVVLELK